METIAANWYDFPDLYEIAFGWDPAPEIDFLEIAFKRLSPHPVRSIYEPFSGAGRLAIPLAQRGYHVLGVELNRPMLARAIQRAASAQVTAAFQQADVANWRCHPPIDAIVTLIDSFRCLAPGDAGAALHAFRASLRPAALLIIGLTVGDPLPAPNAWSAERAGRTVLTTVTDTHDPGPGPGTTLMHYRFDVTEPDGRRHAVECRQPTRRYRLAELQALLRSSGFEPLETWTWRKTPHPISDPDPSDSVVLIARSAAP